MITLTKGYRRSEPYPYAVYDDVISQEFYNELLNSWPEKLSGDRLSNSRYNKSYLSDRHQRDWFGEVLAARPMWKSLYDELHNEFPRMCKDVFGPLGYTGEYAKTWANVEFSALPAEGGGLLPHPDNKKKVVTAVFFMEPDWNPDWGGAFEVLRRPDGKQEVDLAPWDEVETVEAVEVKPRRMVFMQRTPISYHGVRPIHAPRVRRSLTINLTARLLDEASKTN